MTAVVITITLASVAAAYVAWRFDQQREQVEKLRRELRCRRLDAQSMALHLRAAVRRGERVDDECAAAMVRALVWCQATPAGRHRVSSGYRCTACGIGMLAANDSERGGL